MSTSTFQVYGRVYITNDYGDQVKSDDTDDISSIQIALSNTQYARDVPTSIIDGQWLLAEILRSTFIRHAYATGHSVMYVEEITDGEPNSAWEAEAYWAFWCQ